MKNKEWFSPSEVAENLNIASGNTIRKWIRVNKIPTKFLKKDGSYFLIHLDFIEERKAYLANLQENYVSLDEAEEMIGEKKDRLKYLISIGTFKDTEKSGHIIYISKEEVQHYIELKKEQPEDDSVLSLQVIQEEINRSRSATIKFLTDEKRLKAYKHRPSKGKETWAVKVGDWKRFKSLLLSPVEAADYLGVSLEVMDLLLNKQHIKSFDMKDRGLCTHKWYVDDYRKWGYIPPEQLALEMDMKLSLVRNRIVYGDLKAIKVKDRHYIKRTDADEFKSSLKAVKLKNNIENANPYKLFDDALQLSKKKYPEAIDTIDLYDAWVKKILKKSRTPVDKLVGIYVSALDSLMPIEKEIYEFNDDELVALLSSIEFKSHVMYLCRFLNDIKSKRNCKYVGQYTGTHRGEKVTNTSMYSKKEWGEFIKHGVDIDKHFEKAVRSPKYAHAWLYSLLHFSLAWRSSDFQIFNAIYLDMVGIDGFEWFNGENKFTLEMAQKILKAVKRNVDEYYASKNDIKITFVIPFAFEMPTALAFVLCELHRRLEDEDSNKLFDTDLHTKYIDEVFDGLNLPKFRNRRANKTLMTLGWENAVQNGDGTLAYWLGGFSRSHTHHIAMPNDVTQIYLVTKNTDKDVSEMALHAFERGIFGWQVKVMIDALNDNVSMDMDEMTMQIAKVNEKNSPIMLSSLSEYALTRHNDSVGLLQELMKIPKGELRNKLEDIAKLRSPSLIDHSQCLVGVKNCPFLNNGYKAEKPCLGCKNRIDTNYILDIVNVELFAVMERLKGTSDDDIVSRIKYTHMMRSLTYILMDFKKVYDQFDPDYIKSFIDMEQLRANLKEIDANGKLLRIEEVNV